MLRTAIAVGSLVSTMVVVVGLSDVGAAAANSAIPLPFYEFIADHSGGRVWNSYDQTSDTSGPMLDGQPSPLVDPVDGLIHVFLQAGNQDLVEFVNDGRTSGQVWSIYDVTTMSGGPALANAPLAVYDSVANEIRVFAQASNGDLEEYVGASNGWQAVDLTRATGTGMTPNGQVSEISYAGLVHVYAATPGGDLEEFVDDGANGRTWNVYDQSLATGAGALVSAPAAVVIGNAVHVYAQRSGGTLEEFVNDGVGGRPWNAYNLSVGAGNGSPVDGRPAPIDVNGVAHIFVRSVTGDLVEYVNDQQGGRPWNAYDQTTGAGNGQGVVGAPYPMSFGGVLHVYVRSAGGDLLEFVADQVGGHLWNCYDQTAASGGPPLGFDPAAVGWGGLVHVYGGGPPVPAVIRAIAAIAESQDQYAGAVGENPNGSGCNLYTAALGRGSTAGCAPGTAAEEWCSDFAQWVWQTAGINTAGITAWSYTFVDWGLAHGTFRLGAGNDPQPGDAVVWGSTASSYGQHVGLVVGVSQGRIQVVSGNSAYNSVWEGGWFDPTTSSVNGYPIVGYIAPIAWSGIR